MRAALLLTAGSLALAGAGPAGTIAGPAGKIAFSSDRAGTWDIWAANADGSGLVRLTHGRDAERGPRWAPDGRRLAIEQGGGIAVVGADGTRRRVLATTGGAPLWSPDGSTIAFESNARQGGRLTLVAPDGTRRRTLTDLDLDYPVAIAWSPDSKTIAFSGFHGGDGHSTLFAVSADGTALRGLAENLFGVVSLAWSPRGDLLAFSTTRARYGPSEVFTVRPDGTDERQASGS